MMILNHCTKVVRKKIGCKFNSGLTPLIFEPPTFEEKNMNKLLILFFSASILFSCSVTRQYDITGFTIAGNIVSFNGTPMAQLEGVELALDNHAAIEKNFTLVLFLL